MLDGQAAAMSAKVGMFTIRARDARVVPLKAQLTPKQAQPSQKHGGRSGGALLDAAVKLASS